MDFNYEIINEEFENDKVWVIIFKFSTITTLKTMMEFDPNPNLKIFDLPNNIFEPISIFQIKSSFPNMALTIYKFITIHLLIRLQLAHALLNKLRKIAQPFQVNTSQIFLNINKKTI